MMVNTLSIMCHVNKLFNMSYLIIYFPKIHTCEPREIIVKFSSYEVKEKLQENFGKKFKTGMPLNMVLVKNTKASNKNNDGTRIWVKDHLTPKRNFLWRLAKQLKKEGKLKFAWVKRGSILIKVHEDFPVKIVLSETDILDELKNVTAANATASSADTPSK